jgi:GntR family transcriptional repressor for pyruvate dehydrogenase complex
MSTKTATAGASLADQVLRRMLDRIRTGVWRPGTILPGQRHLVEEFNVSSVPLREALSMMKTMGIVEIRHGRKTVIRQADTDLLQQLLPLMFCLEGQRNFAQVYELRLAIESRTAVLAAERRSQADVDSLADWTRKLRAAHLDDTAVFYEADLGFHLRIAEATNNSLFALFFKTISGFVAQTMGCGMNTERRLRAVLAHEAILEAIAKQDTQRAYVEMEAHLRYSSTHFVPADEPMTN